MKKIDIQYNDGATTIFFGQGALMKIRENNGIRGRVFIISEEGVPRCYRDVVLRQFPDAIIHLISSGEAGKSVVEYEACLLHLQKEEFTKKDTIIAVGGGVVGDLAGFVASTYLRGMPWTQVPTTLLAQVDSSIGGKTAINLGGVKNAVGTFWQPKQVFIDPTVLETLDKRQMTNGLVEILKMGLLFDESLVEQIAQETKDLDAIIYRTVELKKEIVCQDEKDSGIRHCLNFGHTLGHAIESLELGNLLHGECVGLGMLAMIENEKLTNRVRDILSSIQSPVTYDGLVLDVVDKIGKDKKREHDRIKLVTLKEIGEWSIVDLSLDAAKEKIKEKSYEKHIGK
ncbi:MAG: 3-dehydroquinate synthase [Anaerorhabdus sp.]